MVMSVPEALWHLARPRMLPYVLLLVLVGFGWAHWDRALDARGVGALLRLLLAWCALHAGTLWLNASVDRDEGEVLMGRSVPPPPSASAAGYTALAVTVALAATTGLGAGLCALGCVVLAVLYSHPKTMWKGHPLGGPAVNLLGYGLLSPMAGFFVVGMPPTVRSMLVAPLVGLVVLGTYFAAQAFQCDEDRARGYRTLVATHGPKVVVDAARHCINLGVLGGLSLAAFGWLPRACLLCLPAWWWLNRWLLRWREQPGGGDASWALGFTRRLLWVGLLGIVGAGIAYVDDSFAERPVAGLGTSAGHPPDRPRLSPRAMRAWEANRLTPLSD
jgi:1,4-dihydroxy-2-naphthoate octaprenyltransferase